MKTYEEYLELPYEMTLVRDRDDEGEGGWVAQVEELPGCLSQGATPEEAVSGVREAMAGWISVALEDGVEIPEPRALMEYSGRFVVRLPGGLHAQLAREAEREGVSLNQFVTNALAAAVHWRVPRASKILGPRSGLLFGAAPMGSHEEAEEGQNELGIGYTLTSPYGEPSACEGSAETAEEEGILYLKLSLDQMKAAATKKYEIELRSAGKGRLPHRTKES
ncbi:MAG: type II toxin-antitoxin system HicB family antitoxin [Actinomycetota bacterium]|nr:type II toxin-antitoxin system HicB family antitoxin [Actinomycetota bacterium]